MNLDYDSVLVSPFSKYKCLVAEKSLKLLTKIDTLDKNLDYWERLALFRVFSNEIRME